MAEIPTSCPRCGAMNTSGAWMCWRCNSTLVTPPAPVRASLPPVQPSSPPPQLSPQSLQPPAPSPARASAQALLVAADYDLSLLASPPRRQARTRQPVLWAMVVASLALLIVTPVVMKGVLPTNSSSELPGSIQGYTRVDNDPTVDGAKAELAKAALKKGTSVTAAVYRQAGKGLVVEVYTGVSPELTASDLLGTLAENLQSQGRTTVIVAQATRAYGGNGVTQACAPMTGDLTGGVCYWTDLKRVGLIMGINADVKETGSLAEAVREAVSG